MHPLHALYASDTNGVIETGKILAIWAGILHTQTPDVRYFYFPGVAACTKR